MTCYMHMTSAAIVVKHSRLSMGEGVIYPPALFVRDINGVVVSRPGRLQCY